MLPPAWLALDLWLAICRAGQADLYEVKSRAIDCVGGGPGERIRFRSVLLGLN